MKDKKRIILVEDDAAISSLYSEVLEDAGFTVSVAQTVHFARELINSKTPNLIILDILLPDQSGLEFLEYLRSQSKFAQLPVIILTVLPEEAAFKKASELGIHGYLVKSEITPDVIVQHVKLALSPKTS